MGDQERLTELRPSGTNDQEQFWRSFRFGVGLASVFLSTVVAVLAIVAVAATAVPRWSSTVVASGSMEPALRRGDTVVYVQKDIDEVDAPEVIIFDDDNAVKTIHRVVSVNDDGTLTTRGDANQSNDSSPVTADELHGAGRIVVPWVGLLRLWWIDGRHALVLAIVLGIALGLRGTRLASGPTADPWAGQPRLTPAHAIAVAASDTDSIPGTLIRPDRRRDLISASLPATG